MRGPQDVTQPKPAKRRCVEPHGNEEEKQKLLLAYMLSADFATSEHKAQYSCHSLCRSCQLLPRCSHSLTPAF